MDRNLSSPMKSTKPKYSKTFHSGYGDLVLQSSDGVLFHYPSALLAHASPLFEDMLTIGTHAASPGRINNAEPLLVQETSFTIDCMLRHIDSRFQTPTINAKTITGLVKAAHKYQIASIIQWFQKEIFSFPRLVLCEPSFRQLGAVSNDQDLRSFVHAHPLLVLSLVDYLGLEDETRRVLRLLVTNTAAGLNESGVSINSSLLRHLVLLRQNRITWYLTQLRNCKSKFRLHKRYKCAGCRADFFEWSADCTERIVDAPTWETVENDLVALQSICSVCGEGEVEVGRTRFDGIIGYKTWKAGALALDAELPELPK